MKLQLKQNWTNTFIFLFILLCFVFSGTGKAMDNVQFFDLLSRMGEMSSDYKKIVLVESSVQDNTLSCDQVALILEYIGDVEDKLFLLDYLLNYIKDIENKVVILYSFKSISEKNKAVEILKEDPRALIVHNGENRYPNVDNHSFYVVKEKIKLKPDLTEKKKVLNSYIDQDLIFTPIQVAELLNLMEMGSERLDFLEILRLNIAISSATDILKIFDCFGEKDCLKVLNMFGGCLPGQDEAIILANWFSPNNRKEALEILKQFNWTNINIGDISNNSNASNSVNLSINIDMSNSNSTKTETGSSGSEETSERVAVDDNRLQDLIRQLNDCSYDDDKIDLLELALVNEYFSCWQVVQILNTFYYSDTQLGALRLLADKILDSENKYIILDVFYYSSDKKEAKEILIDS